MSLFRVFYTPSFNSGWMSFSKRPRKNTPQCYTKPLDSLKNWYNRFFWVDKRVFSTIVDWRMNAPKDGMPAENTYSVEAVRALDTHRTPIQKQPEMLLCLVGISRRYYLGDEVYPTFLHDDDWDMDLFNLIRTPNPTKGAAAPEVSSPEDVPAASAPEAGQAEKVAATDPSATTESCKRGRDEDDVNAPPKVLRRDHADPRPIGSTHSLSFADPGSCHPTDVAQSSQGTAAAGDPKSGNASFASAVGYPESYFFELRHLHNDDFSRQYNVNLARQVAMGSQLRLRFEQEAKLLRKSVAQVARWDKRIQAQKLKIKNLEVLLEAEADMKKAAKDKSVRLSQELEDMRARFSDLQVSNEHLSKQVATLQEQVSGEEKLKAAFEEFKRSLVDVVSAGIAKGMREGLRYGVEHGQAQLSLESIEEYDPETEAKYVAALQALKDLKYPLVDQLEGLKDAPMDVIMAALYLESDTGMMPHSIYTISVPAPLSSPFMCT
nr:transposase (putative), gypsy type [Tanacetum cinerariifolium]